MGIILKVINTVKCKWYHEELSLRSLHYYFLFSLSTIILNNIEEAPVRGQAPATRVVHHPGTKHRACWQQ